MMTYRFMGFSSIGVRAFSTCAVALVSVLVGCGNSEPSTTSTASSSGAGGSGASSTSTSATTSNSSTTGSGGSFTCLDGSHVSQDNTSCETEVSEWVATTSLQRKRDAHVTFVAETPSGPFLYVAAGANGSVIPQIERASILKDGTLSAFSDVGTIPLPVSDPGFAQLDRSFVLAGGLLDDGTSTASSFIGQVADDGSLTFTPGPDLGGSRQYPGLAYAKGFVYAIGGLLQVKAGSGFDQTILDTVERASFDGKTLSAWTQMPALPKPISHGAAVVYQDAIYLIGGLSVTEPVPDVFRADVMDGGDLGPWVKVNDLPSGRATESATVFLDQLFVFSGYLNSAGGITPAVVRASLKSNGAFTDLAPLPLPRGYVHQTPVYQARFYSAGGSGQREVFIGMLQ